MFNFLSTKNDVAFVLNKKKITCSKKWSPNCMINVTYAIIEEKHSIGDNTRISYGIAAYSNENNDSTATIITSIHDITTDKKKLLDLINTCNELQLSTVHLNDIVEDFFVT